MKDEEIRDAVGYDIQWSRDRREEKKDDWLRFYSLYRNYIDQAEYPFEANLAIPTAHTVVEVKTAFILDMIFENPSYVEVLGRTPEGQVSAPAVRQMLDYHFNHSFQIYEDMEKFVRQLLIYGTSIYKVFWDYRPGWKTRFLPDEVAPDLFKPKEMLSAEVLWSKPNGYVVDIFNFGVDPNASSIMDARYAFEEMWLDPVQLMEKQQAGFFKNVGKIVGEWNGDVNQGLKDRLHEIGEQDFQESPYIDRGLVHVIDYWGYLTKGWKRSDGKLSSQAKSQLYHVIMAIPTSAGYNAGITGEILLAEPTPYRHNRIPFVDARIHANVGEFYGQGDIELNESLFLEERDFRNLQLDNLNRTLNKMFKARNGANIDEGELVWRPSGVIHVDEPDDVSILESGGLDPAAFSAMEMIRRDIEQSTGVNDFVMGQYRSSTGFNDTATGITLIQQVALKRIGQIGQTVQRAIRDIGRLTFNLIAQYQPFGTSVRILDRQSAIKYRFIDISPEALQMEYDFDIINAAALGSKTIRQQQMIQLLGLLINLQTAGAPPVDMKAFVRRILDEMNIPNPEELMGYPQFNAPVPEMLLEEGGEPGTSDMLPPEEENRIMMEQKDMIYPKIEENHPHHMAVHFEAYHALKDVPAKDLIRKHYNLHVRMMAFTRNMVADAEANRMVSQANEVNMVRQGMAQAAGAAGGKGTKAKGPAVSQEQMTRNLGAMMGGAT